MISTKKDFFEAIACIPNPILHTGSEPNDYINTWFCVKDSKDYKIRAIELKGCRLIKPSKEANERYFIRKTALIKRYNRWLQEYTDRKLTKI